MRDWFVLTGFLSLVAGVGLLSVPAAFIVAGALLLLSGVVAHFVPEPAKPEAAE